MRTAEQKSFGWKEQLKVGTRGEELFIQNYHSPLVIVPEHKVDFRRVTDGKTIELKTDTYNIAKTPNFFWERFSDVHKKTPGGPWRARKDRVDIYCYYFVRHNLYFEFTDIKRLCKELEKLTKRQGLVFVKNRAWITGGYTVPREKVAHLYTEHQFYPNGNDYDNQELQ